MFLRPCLKKRQAWTGLSSSLLLPTGPHHLFSTQDFIPYTHDSIRFGNVGKRKMSKEMWSTHFSISHTFYTIDYKQTLSTRFSFGSEKPTTRNCPFYQYCLAIKKEHNQINHPLEPITLRVFSPSSTSLNNNKHLGYQLLWGLNIVKLAEKPSLFRNRFLFF